MITSQPFGALSDGTPVTRYLISNGNMQVGILDYGATIQSITVPDKVGVPVDIALGYDTASGYEQGSGCLGATVGRHANRIGGAAFTLGGATYHLEKNNGPNSLHSGTDSYYRRMFAAKVEGDALKLCLTSPDGDQGFPGKLELTVTYTLSDENELLVHFEAASDRDTIVNLTNHSYFDLSGGQDPMGQLLRLDAEAFCENDENILPTGRLLPVAGTAFDFRREKAVGADLNRKEIQLSRCGGYDHNFVLSADGALRDFAVLRSPVTGIAMTVATDLPGVQLYSANSLGGAGKNGRAYGPRRGVCLEPQFYPNAMAIESFQKPILRAGEQYDHSISYRFTAE